MLKSCLRVMFGVSALCLTLSAQAEADPKLWAVVKEAFFPQRAIEEVDFLKVDGPKRAESGAQVPVTFTYDKAAAHGIVLKKLYVIVDANPIQLASTYHLTDKLNGFQLSTRIRQETDSFVRLIGETADGKLYMGSRAIRAAGGCGGTVDNNESEVRAAAGKIKLHVDASGAGTPATTTFNIKHVMRTGLQRDLVSQGYVPAFYISKVLFNYNGAELMTVDVGVGTSEDPYMKFSFIPDAPGKLDVTATDNEGKTFSYSTEVNG